MTERLNSLVLRLMIESKYRKRILESFPSKEDLGDEELDTVVRLEMKTQSLYVTKQWSIPTIVLEEMKIARIFREATPQCLANAGKRLSIEYLAIKAGHSAIALNPSSWYPLLTEFRRFVSKTMNTKCWPEQKLEMLMNEGYTIFEIARICKWYYIKRCRFPLEMGSEEILSQELSVTPTTDSLMNVIDFIRLDSTFAQASDVAIAHYIRPLPWLTLFTHTCNNFESNSTDYKEIAGKAKIRPLSVENSTLVVVSDAITLRRSSKNLFLLSIPSAKHQPKVSPVDVCILMRSCGLDVIMDPNGENFIFKNEKEMTIFAHHLCKVVSRQSQSRNSRRQFKFWRPFFIKYNLDVSELDKNYVNEIGYPGNKPVRGLLNSKKRKAEELDENKEEGIVSTENPSENEDDFGITMNSILFTYGDNDYVQINGMLDLLYNL